MSQVVNRLQRELEVVVRNYHVLEHRLEAEGISVSSISQLEPISTNTECVMLSITPTSTHSTSWAIRQGILLCL